MVVLNDIDAPVSTVVGEWDETAVPMGAEEPTAVLNGENGRRTPARG